MTLNYLGLFVALIVQASIGRRIIKKDGISAIIAAVLIISAIISPLAYYQVSWIKYILFLWTALGLFFFIYDTFIKKDWLFSNLKLREVINFCLIFILLLFYFRGINSSNIIYESHDLVYFSWIKDFLRANYEGPIRISVSWPHLMASNHLLPGAVISTLSSCIIRPTLVTAIEIKYILLSLYFTSFILSWAKSRYISGIFIFFLFVCAFAIFGPEIAYSMRISSFIYLIVFAELLKAILFNGSEREIVFFSLFLIIAKAPIFLIALLISIWYIWKASEVRYYFSSIIAILLVLWNVASWFYAPSPPTINMDFGIAPFTVKSIYALNQVQQWFSPDVFYNFFVEITPKLLFTIVLVIYILIKYYAIYFLFPPINKLNYSNEHMMSGRKIDWLIGLDLYVFGSLATWIFVRFGGNINHVAHAYIIMAFFATFIIIDFLVSQKQLLNYVIFFLFVILYGINNDFSDPFYHSNKFTSQSVTAVTISDIKKYMSNDGFYIPPAREEPGISQVKAAMLGLKLDSRTTPSPMNSQITNWVIINDINLEKNE
jgi:hypothetical protein